MPSPPPVVASIGCWVIPMARVRRGPKLSATARMARVLRVPLTADIEAGNGGGPHRWQKVSQKSSKLARLASISRMGCQTQMRRRGIEAPLHASGASRNAARETGIPIVINARIDLCLKQIGDSASRFTETVRRAEAYMAAGADCIYPFAVTDAEAIGRLTKAIPAPVNIVGHVGTPDVATLERIGVRCVSTASSLTMMAIDEIQRVARELRQHGIFDILNYKTKRPDIQKLFPRSEQ